jgi:phage shock protein PspC (stress-responsive transcriptional regulator)/multisubunit Na+/H+ antiporter MnhE subunit
MSVQTTDTHETKRLRRSRSNRMLGGVCGGLAEYFGIHPAVYRVAFVVIALLPGAGLLIYLAAVLVVPDEGREDSIVAAALRDRRVRRWPLIGLGLIALALAGVALPAALSSSEEWWLLPLLAGLAILWLSRRDVARAETSDAKVRAAEDSRRLRRVLGVFVVVAVALAALAAAFVAVFDVHLRDGVGERSHVVASTRDLRDEYRLGVGELRIDLNSISLPPGETHLEASVDVGALRVIVPDDVALRVRVEADFGQVDLLGEVVDGRDAEARLEQTDDRVLVLDAHVGVGSARITRGLP